jgi:hypothetical protein
MRIAFTDNVEFELDGPLRVEQRRDGFYVVGNGGLIPVASEEGGQNLISELQWKRIQEYDLAWDWSDLAEIYDPWET